MQGKAIVKFFLVAITLVCLFQYLLLLPTRKVEDRADAYAKEVSDGIADPNEQRMAHRMARTRYLDSVSGEEVFRVPLLKSYTYEDLKGQQLALGLDLKGGMSVILRVDLAEFVRSMSQYSNDQNLNSAIELANEKLKNTQDDYISILEDAWEEVAGDQSIAPVFARNAALRDEINFETSNDEVFDVLRERADETVQLTFKLLKERIDKFGVTQPNVSLDEKRDLILVELPGVDNPERARNYLQASAKLEFWDVYRASDPGVMEVFATANERLKSIEAGDTAAITEGRVQLDTVYEPQYDSLGNITDTLTRIDTITDVVPDLTSQQGPLLSRLQLNTASDQQTLLAPLSVMGIADRNQKDAITRMLERPEIRNLFPRDMVFRWSADPVKNFETREVTNQYYLYAIKKKPGSTKAPLEGDRIIRASTSTDQITGDVVVTLSMDGQGARKWGEMTTRAARDNNREIAIILDEEVVSAPRVNTPILDGNSQIQGDYTVQEAQDLANILQIGKLPTKTQIIQESLIGPSLGKENIRKSMYALISGMLIVLLFMILYYGGGGIVSIIALIANLFFIFGALASYGTVLTLPGIAGIVLTIGMAVDANVIIYERIKEELRAGKSMLSAIKDGFKFSYSAIIDANVTTLLTAIVLAYFGLGPIKGFAVVLIIGIIFSLFTAVLFTRLVIDWWTSRDRKIVFTTSVLPDFFSNLKVDWVSKRRVAYVISGIIITAGLISMVVRGWELGVDFKGGYSYNIQFEGNENVQASELRQTLTDVFESEPVVKAVDISNTYNVTTSYLINETAEDASERVIAKLHEGVNMVLENDVPLENFKDPDHTGTHVTSFSKVGPTIADDIQKSSVWATIAALILIFSYILLRFSKWQFSVGAISAIFHDTLVVLSIFSLGYGWLPFSLEIDQAFIAALLTVIGYSMNDTVVVFDRIREYLNTYISRSKKDVINAAINSTMSRTVITSLTTFFVVLVLFIFGGTSIKGFAFALLIGIIVGTYSSVFIATPVMGDLSSDIDLNEETAAQKDARQKIEAEA